MDLSINTSMIMVTTCSCPYHIHMYEDLSEHALDFKPEEKETVKRETDQGMITVSTMTISA